ncbi:MULTISPECIES: SusC/RagA family TonB-linked outer membrane protein [unclassified Sphingobacterium]|uniref:SusC/RagA family TonB-linked outer membrane protein n=1 Tax=unclassified Sphingobacterium TaxID=2609468 RepID=UPI001045D950|nr:MULTISPECIES: SusC/RagA family TonB-linked outer membrane protein [unclassified Sphingobacterium]MCS3555100.1 TonB-linked SusC/RagA family outer membrane protein [Sphingobacterium sp. JUb21]TCR03753.1 TonB-linked SusC/RagA family outer membrane protein [Sphingobacterium sp. JUb20]
MVKNYTSVSFALFLAVVGTQSLHANQKILKLPTIKHGLLRDTVKGESSDNILETDTIGQMMKAMQKFKTIRDTINIRSVIPVPNLSLQQIVKGNLLGVYVQEPNGEPGTEQSMIVQGASGVLFSKRDVYALQPAIYLNGVPMVQENPFAFDVQKYDYNRIGPATNLFSQIDISNIESIAVIKDPFELAKLGPNAVNGAIYVTTKKAKSGLREISLNSYFGYVTAPKVYTVNGVYENNFRKPFYEKYGNQERYDNYASYLRDSTNTAYFGPSNWNDKYYKNTPTYSADLGITGGNDRASFRFFGSGTKNAGNADETNLNRYNISFGINMAPFSWLTMSSNVNTSRLDRTRNKSLRDRFAETRYIPDLSSPLSPNADVFGAFLEENEKNVDNNRVTTLNGNVTLTAHVNKLQIQSSLMFDYNEGSRDFFTPSTLMDGVSYISNYFGYSQRMILNNSASYKFDFAEHHELNLEVGQTYQGDTFKYNYARAYNGPNDYVKLSFVEGDKNKSEYLNSPNFYVFRYIDKEVNNLMSFYGSAQYKYKNLLAVNAIVRRDGSSNGQPDSRWVTTPSFNVNYSLKEQFLKDNTFFNALNLSGGWGRTVRTFLDDRYAAGPQYRSESGWFEEPTIPGYGPVMGINRPYESGFIGYGIKMPVAERTNLTLDGTFLNNRLNAAISAYNRNDKDQLIGVPVAQETGYSVNYKTGLEVNNKGLELMLNGAVVENKNGFNWNSAINVNYNKNKVTALPDGHQELIIGDNKLEVGKSVGSYWVYSNTGIYNTDADVPVDLTFNGIPVKGGDPIWKDYNNDNRVDNKDKVLTGDRIPSFVGGWNNTFAYKNFDLNFNFIFAAGHKALNQYEATKYGFINREAGNDINSIKEVSSWQKIENEKDYPIYNPWSDINPYRVDQDLFLDNASYLKLRSVTIGYDLSKAKFFNASKVGIRRFYVYATGMNLLTVTNFTGVDPELINFNGYYDGANLSIPKTFVIGFKLDL